jgi:predicted RNA-binding protein YlqC (UPF0109 family)
MSDAGTDGSGAPEFEGPSFDDEEIEEDEELHDDHDLANRAAGGMARSVLEHIAKSIVDDPEAVFIDVSEGRSGIRLALHVAPADMGRIIGRRGRVAHAVRVLVRAAAVREGTDAVVDIVDD